jgi:hypothetical protein
MRLFGRKSWVELVPAEDRAAVFGARARLEHERQVHRPQFVVA